MTDSRQDEAPRGTIAQFEDAAGKALEKTKAAATTALDSTRDTASAVARQTAESIEANPISVLVGGLAFGVLAAALLPKTESEARLIGPLGKRLTDTASVAAKAATEAGKEEFAALGFSRDAARDQAAKIFQGVLHALTTAGTAAVTASKTKA